MTNKPEYVDEYLHLVLFLFEANVWVRGGTQNNIQSQQVMAQLSTILFLTLI